jgi:DNA polymerase
MAAPSNLLSPIAAHTFAEWREAARELLAAGVPPQAVAWAPPGRVEPSGAPAAARLAHNPANQLNQPAHLPRSLMDMLQVAACCRVTDRWDLLYRVVWRWQRGERAAQEGDPDGTRLSAMVRQVRREEHQMHENIRFRERPAEAGPPRFVAWYEPAHDVLPQVADHFISRMGKVSWMIATPEASVLWDGMTLHNCGPLVANADELDEPGVAPWLAYYRSVYERRAAPVLAGLGLPGAVRRVIPLHAAGKRSAGEGGEPARPQEPQPHTLEECRRCDLWKYATQPVGGAGSKRARIMLVGEQPGDLEDLAGEPFVGPAGKLLDRVCEAAGVDRRALYVTNAVKHFKWEPRGKRRLHKTPAQREIEACRYWLDKEMAQVRPCVIVALGSTALKSVLGTSHVTLKDTMGRPIKHEGRWVVTIYHPSYALRVPDEAARHQAFSAMVGGMKLARELSARPPDEV